MTTIATSLHTLAEASCPNLSESSRLAWIGGFVEGARGERQRIAAMLRDMPEELLGKLQTALWFAGVHHADYWHSERALLAFLADHLTKGDGL